MEDFIEPGKRTQSGQASPEDDDSCDLDPTKTCDNCMKCVMDADYAAITITGVRMPSEQDE